MIKKIKNLFFFNIISLFFLISFTNADNHNIAELLETIQKDIKTLKKRFTQILQAMK